MITRVWHSTFVLLAVSTLRVQLVAALLAFGAALLLGDSALAGWRNA
jgi:hypothetical protein